ncbi:MAG TPA: MBOAT family O-acyltransferase, partial [Planctomycetota bacterium]|nr:MBOAT family O-acyltransferase [Planctomycetota bacterium]
KILIANPMGHIADTAFGAGALHWYDAWFGLVGYAFQIYFDFSGYSDMAIGLGRMFGFHFPENFAHPYAAQSIRDFWRRWHISLSTFFRDYVYIPLGGNRLGAARSALNLSLVFVLCGFWHGASWAFVVWGAFHGACLSAERLGLDRLIARLPLPARWAYTMTLVMVGWVFFRCETLSHAGMVLAAMAGAGPAAADAGGWQGAIDAQVVLTMVVGAVAAVGAPVALYDRIAARLRATGGAIAEGALQVAGIAFVALVMYASTVTLVSSGFNPFIYYRF